MKSYDIENLNEVVMAGDTLKRHTKVKKITIASGLLKENNELIACKCGILKEKSPNTYWVDCMQKKYKPNKEENVIGVVTKKVGDYFKVDIGAAFEANLHMLAFEGATKKYRPSIIPGDIVYGKLKIATPFYEPEISCINTPGKKEGFGKLSNEGCFLTASINLVKKILNPRCPLLNSLHQTFKYEIILGMNGKIWIKSTNILNNIALANAILSAEFLDFKKIQEFCLQLKETKQDTKEI